MDGRKTDVTAVFSVHEFGDFLNYRIVPHNVRENTDDARTVFLDYFGGFHSSNKFAN